MVVPQHLREGVVFIADGCIIAVSCNGKKMVREIDREGGEGWGKKWGEGKGEEGER